ncbi:hypothetical protein KUF71_001223 [Frankliniella fusca]|uniref:SWIM-type domain-containing protein n=1 Tax=Frankliniella fusca TaxID=407009 RepID=A0AAE1HHW1_9NEOP|nr:hypothetical protein KUF71_001223 [Frankliniella fusca]
MSKLLSILDIAKAAVGFSRPLKEGEEYYERGMLLVVGIKAKTDEKLTIQALAAKTSGVMDKPHEIEVVLNLGMEAGDRVEKLQCSCKAGQSEKCKHVIATLIHLNRTDEEDVEDLTCTDLEQQWGVLKPQHVQNFKPRRTQDLCHVAERKTPFVQSVPPVTPEMRAKWKNILIPAPLSELSIFESGLRINYSAPVNELDKASRRCENELTVKNILSLQTWLVIGHLRKLSENLLQQCEPEIQQFYKERVEASFEKCLQIAEMTAGQAKNDEWLAQREVRVTGSICYSLKTYIHNKNPNWDNKYLELYHSNPHGPDIEHGNQYEDLARDAYVKETGSCVAETGLLVRSELPWLGFSPDGVVLSENRVPLKLLEIKCPKAGKTMSSSLFAEMNALQVLDKNGNMKVKHRYHGQVQLGLLLLGLEVCDFINYSSLKNDYLPITVKFNAKFAKELGTDICKAYFKHMLPRMYANSLISKETISEDEAVYSDN